MSTTRRMARLAGVYSVDRLVRTPEQIVEALFREERLPVSEPPPRPEPCHKRLIARFPPVIEEIDGDTPVPGTTLAPSGGPGRSHFVAARIRCSSA